MITPGRTQRWIRVVIFIVTAALVLHIATGYSFPRMVANDDSMEPEHHPGDLLLVERMNGGRDRVERGWKVMYRTTYPERPNAEFRQFGRVSGLPGDRIENRGGRIEVNGTVFPRPFSDALQASLDRGRIPAGKFLILNVNESSGVFDSARFGAIEGTRIRGRVLVSFPF